MGDVKRRTEAEAMADVKKKRCWGINGGKCITSGKGDNIRMDGVCKCSGGEVK